MAAHVVGMADLGLVDGSGWISDESSFYGDDETREELESRARRGLTRPHESVLSHVSTKRRKPEPHRHSKQYPSDTRTGKVHEHPPLATQLVTSQKDQASPRGPAGSVQRNEATDYLDKDHHRGDQASWQQTETIDDFLTRAPVTDPSTADLGPWLWVRNPKTQWGEKRSESRADVDALVLGGLALLEEFNSHKLEVETNKSGEASRAATREMRRYREQLEDRLLSLAVETGTVCGKWMLFPGPNDLSRCWRIVAGATAEGKLGPMSKVATSDPLMSGMLICVYTYDFTDLDDVRRILDELLNLELIRSEGRPIFYKCDAYTYMDISSGNAMNIRASLYSSKEILQREAITKLESPIARLMKKAKTPQSISLLRR